MAVSIVVVGDFVLEQIDSLVPREHIHREIRNEPFAATTNYLAASGRVLRSVMRTVENDIVGDTFMYECNLNAVEILQIIHHRNRGTAYQACWQVRRITRGVCGEWAGQFASAREAAMQS
jgi:hypothetical protein